MSIEVIHRVWMCRRFKSGTLLVLLAMADWADDDGTGIFPRMATLARKVRMTERAIQAIVRDLESDGVVECVARATGRPGRANEYRIELERLAPELAEGEGGDSPCQGVKNLHPSDGETIHKTGEEISPVSDGEGCNPRQRGVKSATERGEIRDMHIDNRHTDPSCIRHTRAGARADATAPAPGAHPWGAWRSPAIDAFGDPVWQAWFEGSDLIAGTERAVVLVSKPFARNWIENHYVHRLERLFGTDVEVRMKAMAGA